jgi:mannose/cellobiose epimerase-like protein (N-acyl-D-glucosamine 2-epimerase family)
MTITSRGEVLAGATALRDWLFDHALPIWWETGADPRGGFYEKLALDGQPVDLPQRARTVTRQIFSYCEAGKLGWSGPWREAVRHGLTRLTTCFQHVDGTVVALVAGDGQVIDTTFDLYNQAFALLAFASAHEAFPNDTEWRSRAKLLRETLLRAYAHPGGGFYQDRQQQAVPLCSNPHMHLLEAMLAWIDLDDDPPWRAIADNIVTLALSRFVDAESGALREFFSLDWSPQAGREGRIVEPGHQYEWAFLLHRWAHLTGAALPSVACRLIEFADAHGLDRKRRVAVNRLVLGIGVDEADARLWPQTERIRAYTLSLRHPKLSEAIDSFASYLKTPTPGLWYDRLKPGGHFVDEPAPASSLYHIIGAIAALQHTISAADRTS